MKENGEKKWLYSQDPGGDAMQPLFCLILLTAMLNRLREIETTQMLGEGKRAGRTEVILVLIDNFWH